MCTFNTWSHFILRRRIRFYQSWMSKMSPKEELTWSYTLPRLSYHMSAICKTNQYTALYLSLNFNSLNVYSLLWTATLFSARVTLRHVKTIHFHLSFSYSLNVKKSCFFSIGSYALLQKVFVNTCRKAHICSGSHRGAGEYDIQDSLLFWRIRGEGG